jgi:hypothetical protein
MNYDRGSSTILRVVVVVQLQLKVLYMLATHPSSEDDEHASGWSSNDDATSSDMLITVGDCRSISDPTYKTKRIKSYS